MASGRLGTRAPEATRRKILDAAFGEFYVNGFQGGSLDHALNNLAQEMSPPEPLFAAYIPTARNPTNTPSHAARARRLIIVRSKLGDTQAERQAVAAGAGSSSIRTETDLFEA